MSYILKDTTGLIWTRVTDTGRQKISQGNFNISYFQIGDSEVCYNCITGSSTPTIGYNNQNNMIFEPCFNSQNSTQYPQSNKQYVKFPMYAQGVSGNTYGIPFMDSKFEPVYNAAAQRGFFSGDVNSWTTLTTTAYTINSEWTSDYALFQGTNTLYLTASVPCSSNGTISIGDFVTIFIDDTATCGNALSCFPVLTYRITGFSGSDLLLDRDVPDYASLGLVGDARVIVYPSGMTVIYDTYTPLPHWYDDVIDFESVCETDAFDVKIWNMNIPWTETPAGINTSTYVGYDGFGSIEYIGSKQYLGYNSDTGQTDSQGTYYYNSFGERVYTITGTTPSFLRAASTVDLDVGRIKSVLGDDQKTIAIVHYTNNTIDYFYGEKFAFEPYDSSNPNNTTGQARNFKVSLPWLSWHKSPTCTCSGHTFYVDPAGFDSFNLFQPHYLTSNLNVDMNDPGHRYYNLWDTNPNLIDGYPNRVGKVFPDQKIIVFDDEEIVAAMSYKSNRNWTLPAPKVSLITPNVCEGSTSGFTGLLSADTEYFYVTYRLDNQDSSFYSLHCNYYQVIPGPSSSCTTTDQCVAIRFGNEFPCMHTNNATTSGFSATKFSIICQKVVGTARPNPFSWKEIDFTGQLTLSGNLIIPSAITSTTFVVCADNYSSAPTYDLSNYLNLTYLGDSGTTLNFGDEYYFYGVIDTDITATIYEMRYLINLAANQYTYSSNPTWTPGQSIYFTEIGLYDSDKDLLVVSKFQSPQKRIGVQQALVKFDF